MHRSVRVLAHTALRTTMDEIAADAALSQVAVQNLVPVLVAQVQSSGVSQAQQTSAMDALLDVLAHFPETIVQDPSMQASVLETLLGVLHGRAALTKRAIQGLGVLGVECAPATYTQILEHGLATLQGAPPAATRTAIQLLGVLARETPLRLRPVAAARAQDVLHALHAGTNLDQDARDEFLESCLQTLSSLLVHVITPGSMDLHNLVEQVLSLLKYDPNATDYEEEEEEEEEEDDDLLDDDYSDDDDLSWKVRRASGKLLAALCTNHLDAVRPMAYTIASALVARFSEREESVRLEVLSTFTLLLQRLADGPEVSGHKRKRDNVERAERAAPLLDLLPHAVRSLGRQACTGSPVTQIACLDTLAQLAAVFGTAMAPHCAPILAAVRRILSGNREAAAHDRSRALACVTLLRELAIAAPAELAAELPYVVQVYADAIAAKHHRTALEALRASATLSQNVVQALGAQAVVSHLARLYDAALERLQRSDSDQALREAALSTIGTLLCSAGPELGARLEPGLDAIRTRLANEVLRAACLSVVLDVLACETLRPLPLLSAFAQSLLAPLLSLASVPDSNVSVLALRCLYSTLALLREHVPYDGRVAVVQLLRSVPVSAEAPTLAPLLALADLVVRTDPTQSRTVVESVLHAVLPLLGSPTLPTHTLDVLCELLRSLAAAEDSLAPALVSALENTWEAQCAAPTHGSLTPLAFARCLGAAAGTSAALPAMLSRVTALLVAQDAAPQSLGYYTLGVLGQQGTLCGWPEAPVVFSQVLGAPESTGRAFALGGMVLGDAQFRAPLDARLEEDLVPALRILREALSSANDEQLELLTAHYWPRLTLQVLSLSLDDAGQAVLDVLCECIARMVFSDPHSCLQQLEEEVHSHTPAVRAKVLGVARTVVTLDREHALDAMLAPQLWRILQLLGDEELAVRRGAVMALHAVVYNRPELVQEHLGALLPKLYQTTVVREDLKRKVAMGPFTVITDDGLDLRKNAFETLFTLLETCFAEMQVTDVLRCAVQALQDDDSVKLLACLMLMRIADLAPEQVSPFLDEISAPLRTILTRKIRDNATKQEVEKANELTHAAVRVLAHLSAACEVSMYPDFCELIAQTQQSPHAPLLAKLTAAP